jgi:hypothetical protein
MRVLVLCVTLLGILGACGSRIDNRQSFDGVYFRAKAKAVDKRVSLADFEATVSPLSASMKGAREAVQYEAIKYCINNYGTSRIAWAGVAPETESTQWAIDGDQATFRGRCDP